MVQPQTPFTATLAVLAVLLGGCEPESGRPQPRRQPAGQVPQPANQAPAPAADPGAAQDPGKVEMRAMWRSETDHWPKIEYTLEAGAAPAPASGMWSVRSLDGLYSGRWSIEPGVRHGQTVGFTLFGGPSARYAECVIFHRGQPVSHQQTGRTCAAAYTIP